MKKESRAEIFLRDLNTLFADATRHGGDQDILQKTMDAGMRVVGGSRGFLAMVHHETGEMVVACTAGEGWTDDAKRLRVHLAQEDTRGITGHVAVTGQAYYTGDVNSDPYHVRYFDDTRSEVAAPIMGPQGQTRGVINIDSSEPDAFDAEDCAHLVALAQAASVALALEGFEAREAALIEIGMNLTRTLEISELMRKATEVAAEALRFEDCSVFLIDEVSSQLVLQASRGALAGDAGSAAYDLGEGLTGWVALHGEPIRLEEPPLDPRWKGRFTEIPMDEIGAFLAVPIFSRDRVLGVLRVLRRKSFSPWFSNRFTETDERVLSTIASQLGAAVENARSFHKLVRSERMAAWGELSAKSAHMIGNRSFALKGDLNELQHLINELPECVERKNLQEIADSMSRGLERLDEILREFRDFVVATQLTLNTADFNQLIREVVEESYPKRSPVKLTLHLSPDMPPIRCDAGKLKRAFSELIENSLSFQPEGGELIIKTALITGEERTQYGLAWSREYVKAEFTDAGPGVPEDIKKKIFQPFFTSRVKGMGLGLSIVRGIIQAHQGQVFEAGKEGDGATFVVFLPINHMS
jgi:signal transduction histidine kinase